jgi:signal transduction histidine kinase
MQKSRDPQGNRGLRAKLQNYLTRWISTPAIGLAIVKQILDLHGNRINVSSRLNQGTSFEFDLPIAVAA